MTGRAPGQLRLCMAVDIERYSTRSAPGMDSAQRRLLEVLDEAAANVTDMRRAKWHRQPQGDEEVAVLPADLDQTRVIPDFIHELKIALAQCNRELNDSARLRLRLALHWGMVIISPNGFAGDAVNTVCRLCDADELREALRAHRSADLAVAVSEPVYAEVIAHGFRELGPSRFRRVLIDRPGKQFVAEAWIHVPGAERETSPAGRPGSADPDDPGPPVERGGLIQP